MKRALIYFEMRDYEKSEKDMENVKMFFNFNLIIK